MNGEERIRAAFKRAAAEERAALITYLMGGDPAPGKDRLYLEALAQGGADLIEVGIPFSDPVADGETIQRAAVRSLKAGTHPSDVFSSVRELREAGFEQPVIAMTYANIPYRAGYDRFARAMQEADVDGLIVPDMPVEESTALADALGAEGRALVLLAGPLTRGARLERVAAATRGFLYLVASFGTTGARNTLAPETLGLVDAVLPVARDARVPLAVGFGVSRPEQVRELVAHGVDGVVVGSALVAMVEAGKTPQQVQDAVAQLKGGAHASSGA